MGRDGTGTIHWNPRYLNFANCHGFSSRACQPYRAQTKGKVESGIKYVRGNFWTGLSYQNLVDLNDQTLVTLISGLVSTADWIGSMECYFGAAPGSHDLSDYADQSAGNAQRALSELQWDAWQLPTSSPHAWG